MHLAYDSCRPDPSDRCGRLRRAVHNPAAGTAPSHWRDRLVRTGDGRHGAGSSGAFGYATDPASFGVYGKNANRGVAALGTYGARPPGVDRGLGYPAGHEDRRPGQFSRSGRIVIAEGKRKATLPVSPVTTATFGNRDGPVVAQRHLRPVRGRATRTPLRTGRRSKFVPGDPRRRSGPPVHRCSAWRLHPCRIKSAITGQFSAVS